MVDPFLLAELDQQLAPANAAWVLLVLEQQPGLTASELAGQEAAVERLRQRAWQYLQHAEGPAQSCEPGLGDEAAVEAAAQAAAAAGDWQRAGLLWRQLLRPKTPGSR